MRATCAVWIADFLGDHRERGVRSFLPDTVCPFERLLAEVLGAEERQPLADVLGVAVGDPAPAGATPARPSAAPVTRADCGVRRTSSMTGAAPPGAPPSAELRSRYNPPVRPPGHEASDRLARCVQPQEQAPLHECSDVPEQPQERRRRLRRLPRRRETPLELAERIGDAYGLVLVLILTTFVVMMTLPPEGWGGRVAAVAAPALTAVVAFTSSDVRPARVRLAIVIAAASVLAAVIAKALDSEQAAGRRLWRVVDPPGDRGRDHPPAGIVGASRVDFRTILGAISVFTLLGLLFAFLYLAFGRWTTASSSPAWLIRARETSSSSATRP